MKTASENYRWIMITCLQHDHNMKTIGEGWEYVDLPSDACVSLESLDDVQLKWQRLVELSKRGVIFAGICDALPDCHRGRLFASDGKSFRWCEQDDAVPVAEIIPETGKPAAATSLRIREWWSVNKRACKVLRVCPSCFNATTHGDCDRCGDDGEDGEDDRLASWSRVDK